MLLELRAENYAVIDHAIAGFGLGLNLLTGETGAGKSILVEAVGLLHERCGPELTGEIEAPGGISRPCGDRGRGRRGLATGLGQGCAAHEGAHRGQDCTPGYLIFQWNLPKAPSSGAGDGVALRQSKQ